MTQLDLWGEKVKTTPKHKDATRKANAYTGLYALHKYWGKKPYNIMSDLIQEFTSEKEIVLDPFLGSGVSISEAVFNGRKGCGIDINPAAVFITEEIIKNTDVNRLSEEFLKIKKELKSTINGFYSVVRKGDTYTGQNFLWENGTLTEIRYTNGSIKRISTVPEKSDFELINSFNYQDIQGFYPETPFFHNSRINTKSTEKVFELFTPRNLKAISLIYERIEKITDEAVKNTLKFCFTSSIGQASKMVFVIKRRNKTKQETGVKISTKKEVGSWVIGYWKPKDYFENNAWKTFETRVKKVLKAKKEQAKSAQNYMKAHSFEHLQTGADYFLLNKASQTALKSIPENSVDYILTDPPHGNRIPYLELSLLWNSWLQKEVNYSDEIVVSEAKTRNKTIENYNQLLKTVLYECYRVLKPEKFLSFMFNSLDDRAWFNVVYAFYETGFELHTIETLNYSANSVVQDNRKNGLQTDFVIHYKKKNAKDNDKQLVLIDIENDKDAKQTVQLLKMQSYKPYQILNNIISDKLKSGQFFKISTLLKMINDA